jgi:membrane-associated protein
MMVEFFYNAWDFVIHVDRYIDVLFRDYGLWVYALLFLIVFCETGLVITPFLPGDSLLFVSGAVVASQQRSLGALVLIFLGSAILGDMVNYSLGRTAGAKVSGWIKPSYLNQAQDFYAKHGGYTIVLARFMPVIRTFAPFVAGLSEMERGRFMKFNVLGAILWVGIFCGAGYLMGNLAWVKNNLSLLIWTIVFISMLPIFIELYRKTLGFIRNK